MRPRTLDEFIGQGHIIGPGRLLRRAIEADRLTIVHLLRAAGVRQNHAGLHYCAGRPAQPLCKLNAVTSGVADVREVLKAAKERRMMYRTGDLSAAGRMPPVEQGAVATAFFPPLSRALIRFIGSTTENPMIAMTPAIVSRCRVFQFESLEPRKT